MSDNQVLNSLLDTEEKHQQMAQLIILKLAAKWLEKQDWVSSPYGGQNPIQDFIFQTELAANNIWNDFFSDNQNKFKFDIKNLEGQILEMSKMDPQLNEFLNNRGKAWT